MADLSQDQPSLDNATFFLGGMVGLIAGPLLVAWVASKVNPGFRLMDSTGWLAGSMLAGGTLGSLGLRSAVVLVRNQWKLNLAPVFGMPAGGLMGGLIAGEFLDMLLSLAGLDLGLSLLLALLGFLAGGVMGVVYAFVDWTSQRPPADDPTPPIPDEPAG